MPNIIELAINIFEKFYLFGEKFIGIMNTKLSELIALGIGDNNDIFDVPLALLNLLLRRLGIGDITLLEFAVVNGLVLYVLIGIARFFLGLIKT